MKVDMPLLSADARGSICNSLTFSIRKSGQQVRWQKKQKDVITSKRIDQRFKFSQGLILWQSLPPEEKALWNVY